MRNVEAFKHEVKITKNIKNKIFKINIRLNQLNVINKYLNSLMIPRIFELTQTSCLSITAFNGVSK